jgi:light-regulated signal transduction histidine kinase (bacteriophytochrome)
MGTRRDAASGLGCRPTDLAALRALPVAWIVVCDLELRCVLAAGKDIPQAGFRSEGNEGISLCELLPADTWAQWEPLYRAAAGGQSRSLDVQGTDRGRWYRVDVAAWQDQDGAVIGAVALGREISDLLERTEHRAAELQAASKELEAFNYSVSHDLRAPLRAIDGFSAAVLRRNGEQLDDPGREMLERIRKAVARMGTLIDAMLVLSRLSRREMRREHVDLSELANGVGDDLRAREPERNVELVIEQGLSTMGDRELLRIVLENLIGNAWKFTSGRDNARIEFSAANGNGNRSFVIRDNGAGFDMAYADQLFVPFQRLHADEEFPGIGVGLATVNRIVRRHGGGIRGEGTIGAGAAFHLNLDLPAKEESP